MLKGFLSSVSMFYNGKAQIIKVFRCFLFVDEEMKKMFGVTSTLRIIVILHNKLASYMAFQFSLKLVRSHSLKQMTVVSFVLFVQK